MARHSPEKKYDYRNSWNLIKTLIIVIISKSGQGTAMRQVKMLGI